MMYGEGGSEECTREEVGCGGNEYIEIGVCPESKLDGIMNKIIKEMLCKGKGKGMVLYSAISSPLDRSKRFTLSSPGRPVHSDTVLGFSWKHSSHAAIAQRLFNHISTTVYSQVLIYVKVVRTYNEKRRLCV